MWLSKPVRGLASEGLLTANQPTLPIDHSFNDTKRILSSGDSDVVMVSVAAGSLAATRAIEAICKVGPAVQCQVGRRH